MSAEKQKQPSQFGNSLGDMSMEQPEKDPNSTMQYNNEEPTAEQHPINSIASASQNRATAQDQENIPTDQSNDAATLLNDFMAQHPQLNLDSVIEALNRSKSGENRSLDRARPTVSSQDDRSRQPEISNPKDTISAIPTRAFF
jgi:hypothetical protein